MEKVEKFAGRNFSRFRKFFGHSWKFVWNCIAQENKKRSSKSSALLAFTFPFSWDAVWEDSNRADLALWCNSGQISHLPTKRNLLRSFKWCDEHSIKDAERMMASVQWHVNIAHSVGIIRMPFTLNCLIDNSVSASIWWTSSDGGNFFFWRGQKKNGFARGSN